MKCSYFDCFTCPYKDCIATEYEALKRDQIEGWSIGEGCKDPEENRRRWMEYQEKEKERAKREWAYQKAYQKAYRAKKKAQKLEATG